MNKSVFSVFVLAAVLIMASCNSQRFKKTDDGMDYKIVKGGGGDSLKMGDFALLVISQYYNDSLLSTPIDSVPQLVPVDSGQVPPVYVRLFLQSRVGDSVVTRMSTDTLIKHGRPLPPFAKENNYFFTTFRIVDVVHSKEEAQKMSLQLRERAMRADSIGREDQKKADDKAIRDYLEKNSIKAEKSPEGTYVQIIKQGTGPKVDSGLAVSVLYKGTFFNGDVFDQSYDADGKPTEPFTFIPMEPGAIQGWSDGMVYFNEGGEGRLFIPSARAYGPMGNQGIPPNTPLIFDVKITKVQSKEAHLKDVEAQRQDAQRRLEEAQEKARAKAKQEKK
ncbi:MAG: FKBP-type peptidyl-prolyl cis-trans isomerase [Chitinophagaceae bacterium]|nr:FKBP-type peptidyl-prolyl cis-trans isomerase [Chitinophagaceae bacterium]